MASIKNIDGLSVSEMNRELNNGAKFVIFQYAFSILIMTFKRPTAIYFIRAGEGTFRYHWPFTLISLLFGWWGFPWGLIYIPMALFNNLNGGKGVTSEVLAQIITSPPPPPEDA